MWSPPKHRGKSGAAARIALGLPLWDGVAESRHRSAVGAHHLVHLGRRQVALPIPRGAGAEEPAVQGPLVAFAFFVLAQPRKG